MTRPADPDRRPAGEARDEEILDAAVDVLSDVGYDRFTMDAVAARARAGKATLYRRWASKAELVVDALTRVEASRASHAGDDGADGGRPDLRGELLSLCGKGPGITDERNLSVVSGLLTAMHRNPELARTFHERFLAPRQAEMQAVFERARARGEVRQDADLELLGQVIPGQIYYCMFAGSGAVAPELIVRVIDEVVLPAALRCPPGATSDGASTSTTRT